jgi:hypothetical protein
MINNNYLGFIIRSALLFLQPTTADRCGRKAKNTTRYDLDNFRGI